MTCFRLSRIADNSLILVDDRAHLGRSSRSKVRSPPGHTILLAHSIRG